jgi:hypothetical protein
MSGFDVMTLNDDPDNRVFGYYQAPDGSIRERLLRNPSNWTSQTTSDLVVPSNSTKSTTHIAATSLSMSNTVWVSWTSR